MTGREGDRGGMLEEINRRRAMLDRCVFLWVPSHRGISPNSMADAAAKAYLEQPVDAEGVTAVAEAVLTRPCLYAVRGAGGGVPALRDRRVYAEAFARVGTWVHAMLRKGTSHGIVMGLEGRLWTGVAARVGQGTVLDSDWDTDTMAGAGTAAAATGAAAVGAATAAAAGATAGATNTANAATAAAVTTATANATTATANVATATTTVVAATVVTSAAAAAAAADANNNASTAAAAGATTTAAAGALPPLPPLAGPELPRPSGPVIAVAVPAHASAGATPATAVGAAFPRHASADVAAAVTSMPAGAGRAPATAAASATTTGAAPSAPSSSADCAGAAAAADGRAEPRAAGALAGVLALETSEPGGEPNVFIHEVARDPALPEGTRGIGTALLREALLATRERFERALGVVQLLVDAGNAEAVQWYRKLGFRAIAGLVDASGAAVGSELPGAQPVYEPKWQLGRRRGEPARPQQICMQADGEELLQRLRARPTTPRVATLERHAPGELGALRRSGAWTAARRLVDAAHSATRGVARGGSGKEATELLPPREIEERVVYVLARLRAPEGGAETMGGPSATATLQGLDNEWDMDEELEEEQAMMAEGPVPPGEMSPPGTPGSSTGSSPAATPGSSPAATPPPSVTHASPVASPASSRPPSPAAVRWRAACEADDVEGDEEETLETMAARLRRVRSEEEARLERKRSLEAREALNKRKGLTHGLRVGEVDGAEHGAMHDRRCETEAARAGKARASVEGAGPLPQLRGLGGGCVCCGWQGGCTPRHVLLGECGCAQVDWEGYLAKLLEALERVKEAVPKTTLDMSTPLAAWCRCRPVVCAAVAALERRCAGGDAGEAGWRAVRMVLTGLLPECTKATSAEERERRRIESGVAKAVMEAQATAVRLLGQYGAATRKLRAEKREQLEEWWVEERRQRALRAKMGRLLRAAAAAGLLERKRRREVLMDAVAGAQVAAAEEERRKRLRRGEEVARTRKGGLHRVGTYDQTTRRRKAPVEWEAGDAKRSSGGRGGGGDGRGGGSGTGGGGGRGGGGGSGIGAGSASGGGGSGGSGGGRSGGSGGGGGGGVGWGDGGGSGLPPPPPSLTPPPPPRAAGAKRRAAAAESRWQSGAVEQFGAAVRKRQRDGDA